MSDQAQGWEDYYQFSAARAHSPLLRAALDFLASPHPGRYAIDLGCGAGRESASLLRAGWRVLAIDQEPAAIARVQSLAKDLGRGQLATRVIQFEAIDELPSSSLIHAGFALPFCSPSHFPKFWRVVMQALAPGAVFAGHLFGNRDAWAGQPGMTFHTEENARALFSGLEILQFQTLDAIGPSMAGPKHWHRFDIVARKPHDLSGA